MTDLAHLSDLDRIGLMGDIGDLARTVRDAELQLARVVGEARQRGLTWEEVAAGLGVSKQAAHKRFRAQRVGYDDVPLSNG